jgi:hypothetical protein
MASLYGEFPVIPEQYIGPGEDKFMAKSVMRGMPSNPPPAEPSFDPEIKKLYDIATPQERAKLASGDIRFEELDQYYKQKDAQSAALIKQGTPFNPYAGDTRYEYKDQGEIKPADEGFLLKQQYRLNENAPGYEVAADVLKRASLKGLYGLAESGGGQQRFLAEAILGVDPQDTIKTLDYINKQTEAIGDPKSRALKTFENAGSSIIQQLPGMLTGTEALALGSMFWNAFGSTYDDSRRQKLDMTESALRSAAFASLEVLGEKFGLPHTIQGLKAAAKGVPTSQLSEFFAKAIKRDIVGELGTYTGQFGVDKAFSLNAEAGVKQFIDGAVDTVLQTIVQGGMLGGGAHAVNAARRRYSESAAEARATDAAELAKQNALQKAEAMFNPPGKKARAEETGATEEEAPPAQIVPTQRAAPEEVPESELQDTRAMMEELFPPGSKPETISFDDALKLIPVKEEEVKETPEAKEEVPAEQAKLAAPVEEVKAEEIKAEEPKLSPEDQSRLKNAKEDLEKWTASLENLTQQGFTAESHYGVEAAQKYITEAQNIINELEPKAWQSTPFAPRIEAYLKTLEDAGEDTRSLRKNLDFEAQHGKITDENVTFREGYARRVVADKAREAGQVIVPEITKVDGNELDKLTTNVATALPIEIQQAASDKFNNLGERLAKLGYKFGEVNAGTKSALAKAIHSQMQSILHSLMLLAPARYTNAKGHKNAKPEKLARFEKETSDILGIDTTAYPGINTDQKISATSGRPSAVGAKAVSATAPATVKGVEKSVGGYDFKNLLQVKTPADIVKVLNLEPNTLVSTAFQKAKDLGYDGIEFTKDKSWVSFIPEQLGVNSIPLSDPDGKPFATKKAAQKEKKNHPDLRVISVEGGFALAPKTEAQIAAQKKSAERLKKAAVSSGEALAAHEFIALEGGLSPDEKSEMSIQGNVRVGNRSLFAAEGKGMSIEKATEKLQQAGYLDTDNHNAAYALIKRSIKEPQYAMEDIDAVAEQKFLARQEAEYQDFLDAQDDMDNPFASLEGDGYTSSELSRSGFVEASEEIQKEVAALSALAEEEGIDVDPIIELASKQSESKTQQEYYENVKGKLEEAIAETAQQRSDRNIGEANVAEEAEAGLTAPTREELNAKAEAAEKAAAEDKKQQQLMKAATQAERERAEIEMRSQAAADTFELGQSAEDNLSGQTGLFNISRPVVSQEEQDSRNATRDEKLTQYKSLRQKLAAIQRRFATDTSKPADAENEKWMYEYSKRLQEELASTKQPRMTPEQFLARAAQNLADGHISQDVYDTIDTLYRRSPHLLNGLRLSVKSAPEGRSGYAGQFIPYERIVRLFKRTEGVEDPSTVRHELTHSLELMMTPQAQSAIIEAWGKALLKASKAAKTNEEKQFFVKVGEFLDKPNQETMDAAIGALPDYSYYQYVNPSEYWAVNAEKLMAAHLGSKWQQFKSAVRGLFEGMKKLFGFDNKRDIHKVFKQVMTGERITNTTLVNYIGAISSMYNVNPLIQPNLPGVPPVQKTKRRNYRGDYAPPASFNAPIESKKDSLAYHFQDKYVDTKAVQNAIKAEGKAIKDEYDVYLQEELYHGRLSKIKSDFVNRELAPIVDEMHENKVTNEDIDTFLQNRHAKERNDFINTVNPDPDIQDTGSGISTEDAQDYLDNLPPERKKVLESIANKIDKIIRGTQDILVENGLETQQTIDTWRKTYKHYVPLFREDLDFVNHGSQSMFEKGYGTRGSVTKRAVGSLKPVGEIFAKVVLQREAAYIRSERARIGRALYALAISNPNPDFWLPVNPDAVKNKEKMIAELKGLGLEAGLAANLIKEPQQAYIDPETGLVAYRSNPQMHGADNVFPIRINGKDRYIFFNGADPRAMRMVTALRNLDAAALNTVFNYVGGVTRWMASVNTQYNPIFGIWNFVRDVGGTQLSLSTTPLAGKKWLVNKNIMKAWRGIYKDLRSDGKAGNNEWANHWEDMQRHGGQTGYSEQFAKRDEKASIVNRELKKRDRGWAKRSAYAVADWLSDYNDTMENAVRLAVYVAAITPKSEGGAGLSKERAASVAKNITVNFNRKGAMSQQFGVLYAFFNASVQGNARIYETLRGPAGKKIIAGGLLMGVMQAVALALAGFDDDDIPDYLKDRNLIIPYGNKKYFMIPMPLGYSAIPGISRIVTEWVLSGGKNTGKKSMALLELLLTSANPLGGNSIVGAIAPTVVDPFVALYANKDSFGRPIARKDTDLKPTPGYMRTRESASEFSKALSEFLNFVTSGGNKYTKGWISPTGDEIDYVIGQFTGGVGREVMNAGKAISSAIKGEDVEPHKVPIAGKIIGDAESRTGITSKFYKNITQMSEYETEITQRRKNRENAYDVIRNNPEAALWERAKSVENEITALNRRKKELIDKKANQSMIKTIEDRKIRIMKSFNDLVTRRSQ